MCVKVFILQWDGISCDRRLAAVKIIKFSTLHSPYIDAREANDIDYGKTGNVTPAKCELINKMQMNIRKSAKFASFP